MDKQKKLNTRNIHTASCRGINIEKQRSPQEEKQISKDEKCQLFLSSPTFLYQISSLKPSHQDFNHTLKLQKSKYKKNTIHTLESDLLYSSKKHQLRYKRGRNQERQKFMSMENQISKLQNFVKRIPNLTQLDLTQYRQIYLTSYLDDFIQILGNQCEEKANFMRKLWNQTSKIINSLLERIIKKFKRDEENELKNSIDVHSQYQKVLQEYKQQTDKLKKKHQEQLKLIRKLSQSLKRKKKQHKLLSGGINYCSQQISLIKQKYTVLRSEHIDILVTGHSGMPKQQAEFIISQKENMAEAFNNIQNFKQKGYNRGLNRKIRESVFARINEQIKMDRKTLQEINVIVQNADEILSQQEIPIQPKASSQNKVFKFAGVQTVQFKGQKQPNPCFSQSFNCFDKLDQQLTKNKGTQTVKEKVQFRPSPFSYQDLYAKKSDKLKIQATVGFKYRGINQAKPQVKQYQPKIIFISATNTIKSIKSIRQIDENITQRKNELSKYELRFGQTEEDIGQSSDNNPKQQMQKSKKNLKKSSSNLRHLKTTSNFSKKQFKSQNVKSVQKSGTPNVAHMRIKTQGNTKKEGPKKFQSPWQTIDSGQNTKFSSFSDKSRPNSSSGINSMQFKKVSKLNKQKLINQIKNCIKKQTKRKFDMKHFFQNVKIYNEKIYANQTIDHILKYNAEQLRAKKIDNMQKHQKIKEENTLIDVGQCLNMFFVNRKVRKNINQRLRNRKRSSLIVAQRTVKKGIEDVHRAAYALLKHKNIKINFMQLLHQSIERQYSNLKAQQTQNKKMLFVESIIFYSSSNYFYRNFLLLSSVFSQQENYNIVFSTDIVFYLKLLEKLNCNQKQLIDFEACYTTVDRLNLIIQTFVKQYYPFSSLVQYIQQSIDSILMSQVAQDTKLDIYKCCNLIICETLKLKVQIMKSYEFLFIKVQNLTKKQEAGPNQSQTGVISQLKQRSEQSLSEPKQNFFRELISFLFYSKLRYLKLFNQFRRICGTQQISIQCLSNFLMNESIPEFDKLALSNSFYFDIPIDVSLNYQSETYNKMKKYVEKKNRSEDGQNKQNRIVSLIMDQQQNLIPPNHALTLIKMMITQKAFNWFQLMLILCNDYLPTVILRGLNKALQLQSL